MQFQEPGFKKEKPLELKGYSFRNAQSQKKNYSFYLYLHKANKAFESQISKHFYKRFELLNNCCLETDSSF